MEGRRLAVVIAVACVLVLGVPTIGHASAGRPTGVSPSRPSLVSDELAIPSHAVARPLSPSTEMSMTFTLPYAHATQLGELLAEVQDPASPLYRHFLTSSQFAQEFGPSSDDVQAVSKELQLAGATHLSVSPTRAVISAVLPAGVVERLLNVHFLVYGQYRDGPLYSAVGSPSLPPGLAGRITGIGGLSDGANPYLTLSAHPGRVAPVRGTSASQFVLSNTSEEWFVGSDFTQAYRASVLFPNGTFGGNATFAKRVAVATLLAGGYNESTDQNLPGWDPTVVQQYFNDSFPRSWPQSVAAGVPVVVNGISPPPPGSFGTLNDSSLDEFENSLDLEMAGSLAPGAALYNFYFAGSILAGSTPIGDIADDFADDLSAALSFNYSPAHLGVVSGSFGLPDLNDSAWNADLTEAAATGVTVVMASGDQGDAPDSLTGRGDGQWPVWPASTAFNTSGALSVGGASVTIDGVPTTTWNGTSLNVSFDSNLSGFSSMSAWWDTAGCPTSCAGTEGGLSQTVPEPYWQIHSAAQPAIASAGAVQGASLLGRAGPDLAFAANSTIAYVYANATGSVYFTVLEGTSVAAPLFAGLLADVISVENRSGLPLGLGYLDPEVYRMAGYYAANPGPTSPFFDVTMGGNYLFEAGTGWDAATGWGGLNAPLFVAADENRTISDYRYTGPSPGIPATSSAPLPDVAVYVILGLAVVLAVLVVLIFAWPRRKAAPPPAPGYGPPGSVYGVAPAPPPSPYALPLPAPTELGRTTATFLCPYCGSVRPAEPVRCPRCGAL